MKKGSVPSLFLLDALAMVVLGLIIIRYALLAQSLGKDIFYLICLAVATINFAHALFCFILFIVYSTPSPKSNKED